MRLFGSDSEVNKGGTVGVLASVLLAGVAMLSPGRVMAQPAPATVHGHVTNAAGQPVGKGEVRLTTDRSSDEKSRKYAYTFPLDGSGNYTGAGVAPGNYVAIVFSDNKSLDFIESLQVAAGEDKTANFDMTRKEYMDKMTPEEKKALEDFKKQNSEATAANSKIANLNTLLAQARTDNKSGNYAAAITAMQQATTAKPDEAILWITLGDAQLGAADTDAKAAKAAGKPATDPAISAKYTDAAASYKKGVDLNAASKKPSPETAGTAYNQMGTAYGKMGDAKNASDAYDNAAKALPAQAGMYYFNEAATLYNAGKMDDAAIAADKAIAADPKRPDAYYIKAQALIPKATVDPKTQKIVAPPGCVDAYQSYLELAPDGSHAEDVKGILAGIGEQVKSSYKAGAKKK
jgi:tetratricopeptide (TPR) repeat protein